MTSGRVAHSRLARFLALVILLVGAAARGDTPPAPAAGGAPPPSSAHDQAPPAPVAGGKKPPQPFARVVYGHATLLVPVATFSTNGNAAIGRDFVTVGLNPGVSVVITPHWSIALDTVALTTWQRVSGGPDVQRTTMVGAAGPFYGFRQFFVGVQLTLRVGEGVPFNVGLTPVVGAAIKLAKGRFTLVLQVALPFFVDATPGRTTESLGVIPAPGISF